MMRRATDKGFSALELAMVMLIVTMATAVVMVVGKGARDKARATNCMSNLDGIAIAAAMYAADHDGFYPHAEPFARVYPYIKNSQIMRCPAAAVKPLPDSNCEQVDYYFELGLASDDRPDTVLAYDDVPDRHRRRSFNMVRIDGAAKNLPADKWPGVPRRYGPNENRLLPEGMMPGPEEMPR
jgi:hypothetical protein